MNERDKEVETLLVQVEADRVCTLQRYLDTIFSEGTQSFLRGHNLPSLLTPEIFFIPEIFFNPRDIPQSRDISQPSEIPLTPRDNPYPLRYPPPPPPPKKKMLLRVHFPH